MQAKLPKKIEISLNIEKNSSVIGIALKRGGKKTISSFVTAVQLKSDKSIYQCP